MSKEPPQSAYTPEGRAHAYEAKRLSELLSEEMGVPFQKVYPTADHLGKVTLTFRQTWDLMGWPEGLAQFEKDEEYDQGGG